jgi:hypothetical protein
MSFEFPDPDSGPDFSWIGADVESIPTDANMSDWEAEGRPLVFLQGDHCSDRWIVAEDDSAWVDLEGWA